MSLPVRVSANRYHDSAVLLDSHGCRLGQSGTEPADFCPGHYPDPEELAGHPGLSLLSPQPLVVRDLEGLGHVRLVVGGVVGEAPWRLERELLLADVVDHAELDWVQFELGGEDVHGPFEEVRRLRAASASVGPVGDLVREYRVDVSLVCGYVVDPGAHLGGQLGKTGRGAVRVRAPVRNHLDLVSQYLPVLADGDLCPLVLPPSMGHSEHVLAPALFPLYRPLEVPRRVAYDDVLLVSRGLATEAPADVGGDDAHARRVHPEKVCQGVPQCVGVLGREPDRQEVISAVVAGGYPPRLHRDRVDAWCDQLDLDDPVCIAERGLHVSERVEVVVPDVVRELLVDLRGARLDRGLHVHYGLERLIVHFDELRRVLSLVVALCEDHGDGFASEVHLADSEHLPDRSLLLDTGGDASLGARLVDGGHRVDLALEVLPGQRPDDARRRKRGVHVDA